MWARAVTVQFSETPIRRTTQFLPTSRLVTRVLHVTLSKLSSGIAVAERTHPDRSTNVNLRTLRIISGIVAIIATLCVIGAATLPAKEIVAIRMPGRYYSEPATVRIMIAVEPDSANRRLTVEADGDSFFRSSEYTLDGERGQRLHTVEFKNLPAGQYV